MLLVNYRSYLSFIFSDYSLLARVKILLLIFLGTFQSFSIQDSILLLITAILFGLNTQLILRKLKFLSSYGNLHVTFGVGLITLATTGCASCGLSLASVVGLTGVLVALPFKGLELYIASIFILLLSLFYNLNTLVKVCNIRKF